MKTAVISGGLGDIVYALKICKALHVTTLHVRKLALEDGGNTFTAVENIISSQNINAVPIECSLPLYQFPEGLVYDYNFDTFRQQPKRGRNHIIYSMAQQLQAKIKLQEPWLKNIPTWESEKDVVFVTNRWRENSRLKWKQVLKRFDVQGIFLGFRQDFVNFCVQTDGEAASRLTFVPTENLYEVAAIIKGGKRLFCNQNPALAIVQGLGSKPYYCEFKPGKTNTRLFTTFENCL